MAGILQRFSAKRLKLALAIGAFKLQSGRRCLPDVDTSPSRQWKQPRSWDEPHLAEREKMPTELGGKRGCPLSIPQRRNNEDHFGPRLDSLAIHALARTRVATNADLKTCELTYIFSRLDSPGTVSWYNCTVESSSDGTMNRITYMISECTR